LKTTTIAPVQGDYTMSDDIPHNLSQKEVKWLKRIRAARASGNISQWCRDNNVARQDLYTWERRITKKGAATEPGVENDDVIGPSIAEDGGLGYLENLTKPEREFVTRRKEEYLEDYPDLNNSVDMMSLHILLMQEIDIARLLKQQAKGSDVSERLERAQKIFQNTANKLGIDREDRLKRGETGNEGDIASFALEMQSDMPDILKTLEREEEEEEELLRERRAEGRDATAIRTEAPDEEEVLVDGSAD
jgi:hypothetical protein